MLVGCPAKLHFDTNILFGCCDKLFVFLAVEGKCLPWFLRPACSMFFSGVGNVIVGDA